MLPRTLARIRHGMARRTPSAPRPHRTGTPAGTVAVAVTLAVLSGCTTSNGSGSGDPGGASPTGGATGADDGTADGDDTSDDLFDERHPRTPLSEFWSSANTMVEFDQEEARRQLREVENRVAACMRAQGFEYIAQEPLLDVDQPIVRLNDGPWGLPPEEFAARYGYGITTMDGSERVGLDVEDPNQALVDAMSDAERDAYYEALWGPGVEMHAGGRIMVWSKSATSEDDDGPFEPQGCRSQASAEVYGTPGDVTEDMTNVTEQFGGVFEEMQALWDRIVGDPRVAAAAATWSGCMADAGHPGFDQPDDAQSSIWERVSALAEEVGTGHIGDGDGATIVSADGVGILTLGLGGVQLDQLDPAVLQELREHEIAVAVADLGCRADYDEVRLEVQIEVEQRFLDQYGAELERYRDAVSAGGGVG